MGALVGIGGIAALVVWCFVAKAFQRIAAMKGHDEARCFWWTPDSMRKLSLPLDNFTLGLKSDGTVVGTGKLPFATSDLKAITVAD